MSGKEYTKIAIKEQEVKVGDKKFFIKTDTDQTVKFEKDDVEKGVEAKDKLKVKYAEKKEDGIILDKKVEGMGEMQQEIKPGIGFFKAISNKEDKEEEVKEEDFDSFLRDERDKLVLVKFSTVWCPPCQVLQKSIERLLSELETTAEPSKDLVVLQVDAEKFPRLAQRSPFNVSSVPVIFLFHQGKMIKRGSGSMSVQQLRDLTGEYQLIFKNWRGVVQLVEHRPSDPIVVGSAELVDAWDLRSYGHMSLPVRVRLWVPRRKFTLKRQMEASGNQITIKGAPETDLEVRIIEKKDKEERKIIVEPGERAKFEQAKKEMHKKLLKEKFNDKIDKDSKLDAKGLDMKYIILPDGNGNYKVKIY
ncbi:4671_t:CDS:2 [Funneliformis geosporum]|nr:4671_t:CDS:2 [Funneliformis geosporum]